MSNCRVFFYNRCPNYFLNVPQVKDKTNTVFDEMNSQIVLRFNEIMEFIKSHNTDIYNKIKFYKVLQDFKTYFFDYVYNKAINSANEDVNLIEVMISLITTENVKKSLLDKPMIYAFANSIYDIQIDDPLTKCLYDGFVILLENHFLDNK